MDELCHEWISFFESAGISQPEATNYAITFNENRMKMTESHLSDLNKEYLADMNVKAIGDVMAILKYARVVHDQLLRDKVSTINPPNLSTKLQNHPQSTQGSIQTWPNNSGMIKSSSNLQLQSQRTVFRGSDETKQITLKAQVSKPTAAAPIFTVPKVMEIGRNKPAPQTHNKNVRIFKRASIPHTQDTKGRADEDKGAYTVILPKKLTSKLESPKSSSTNIFSRVVAEEKKTRDEQPQETSNMRPQTLESKSIFARVKPCAGLSENMKTTIVKNVDPSKLANKVNEKRPGSGGVKRAAADTSVDMGSRVQVSQKSTLFGDNRKKSNETARSPSPSFIINLPANMPTSAVDDDELFEPSKVMPPAIKRGRISPITVMSSADSTSSIRKKVTSNGKVSGRMRSDTLEVGNNVRERITGPGPARKPGGIVSARHGGIASARHGGIASARHGGIASASPLHARRGGIVSASPLHARRGGIASATPLHARHGGIVSASPLHARHGGIARHPRRGGTNSRSREILRGKGRRNGLYGRLG